MNSLTTSIRISNQMDHNANQPALTSAMDLSVSSSSGPIELNPVTSGVGPINNLPNEMMQMVMAKLGLDGDVKKLIRLRLVSTRWRAVVEDYCRLKKALFVTLDRKAFSSNISSYFELIFFGFTNSKNCTYLFLSSKMPSECFGALLNLFPNVEQLSIGNVYFGEHTLDNSLEVYIKSLNSLKLLDLNGLSIAQLSPVLSKLKHFSYDYSSAFGHTDDLLQLISRLGQGCVRVNLGKDATFVYDQFTQWHIINPNWLANLTHLRMHIRSDTNEEYARVVHLLCEHAILLKHLRLKFNTMRALLRLTPAVLEDIGKLTHLTKLAICGIKIAFSELEQSALQLRLTSLTSLLACKLVVFIGDDLFDYEFIDGDQFNRVLSVIFPNMVELNLTFVPIDNSAKAIGQVLQHEIEQHLDRLPNLRKHNIRVLKSLNF